MTINDLVRRLAEHLTTVVAELRLETCDGTAQRPPVLVAGWLPPKRSTDQNDFPFLVVRPATGTDAEDGARVVVKLLFGTFSESVEGWQDLGNVIQRVMTSFDLTRTLGPFCLEKPLTWTIYDEQPLPQWAAEMTTRVNSPKVG